MNHEIFVTIKSIIDKIIFSARKQFFEIEGERLYSSEIHLILYINGNKEQSKNATKIAEALGVTKGAISQNLSRLERKGVISKEKDAYKKNELSLFFTPKGKKVLEGCLKIQAERQKTHDYLLKDFSIKHKEMVLKFLKRFEKVIR